MATVLPTGQLPRSWAVRLSACGTGACGPRVMRASFPDRRARRRHGSRPWSVRTVNSGKPMRSLRRPACGCLFWLAQLFFAVEGSPGWRGAMTSGMFLVVRRSLRGFGWRLVAVSASHSVQVTRRERLLCALGQRAGFSAMPFWAWLPVLDYFWILRRKTPRLVVSGGAFGCFLYREFWFLLGLAATYSPTS